MRRGADWLALCIAAKPLDTEQQSHAIEQLYFDHIPLGLPEPKVIAALGKAPEDAKSYMTKGVVRAGDRGTGP